MDFPPDEFVPARRWRCMRCDGVVLAESANEDWITTMCPENAVVQRLYERTGYDYKEFWR